MDYAFVPGGTSYEQELQRLMQNRAPKTTLINKNGVNTVADFLQELVSQNLTGGDLILGAHASSSDFFMPFDAATTTRTDYEKIEALSAAGTIHIPSSVRGPNTSVHLKGCRIGDTARPLLSAIKAAMDNPQQVTAPRFFHVLIDDAGQGVFEYMRYSYEVTTPDPKKFDKRADLVVAFQSPPQPFMQGVEAGKPQVAVPKANFEKWVPTQAQLDSLNDEVKLDFTVNLDPFVIRLNPVTGKKLTIKVIWHSAIFTAFPDTFIWKIDMTGKMVPSDKAGQLALLQPSMQTDPKMKFPPAHPFPYYVRYGFPDFASFFAGFDWTPTLVIDGSKQTLTFVGTEYIYRLEIPVVKTGTSTLIYNYYPNSGGPTMNFREDNATYEMFGTT
jgi:hypothetical protein